MRQKDMTRRNVTLPDYVAKNLEQVSRFTGLSQGDIITRALRQGGTARLFAYATSPDPVVGLLDRIQYQVDTGTADAGVGRGVLEVFLEAYLPFVTMKPVSVVEENKKMVESYIMSHMPMWCADRNTHLKEVYERCKNGAFIRTTVDVRESIQAYVSAVLSDNDFLKESYLYRNLAIWLEKLCNCSGGAVVSFYRALVEYSSGIFGISSEYLGEKG